MRAEKPIAEEKYSNYELEVLAIHHLRSLPSAKHSSSQCVKRIFVFEWQDGFLLLEEFNYKVEERYGRIMTHVDVVSHNPLPTLVKEKEKEIIVRLKKSRSGE